MWRCSTAISHSGMMDSECSGKAGMPFRTTSVQDDPTWRTTQFNSLLPCWMLINQWTALELAAEVWVCHKTVLHILCYHQLAVRWICHEISKVQQWHCYAVAQVLLNQYKKEGDDFLGWIITMDETCARSNEPTWNANQINGSILVLMFIVVYDIDGVILHHAVPPRQTVNAAYYCMFLQHHFHPALRKNRWHLVVLNPIILHDNARGHTAAVTDRLRHWQWEILEHPLYSADMSPYNYDLFTEVK